MAIKPIHSLKVAATDYARPNRYEVEITPPGVVELGEHKDLRRILLNCNTAEVPGKIIGTVDHRTSGPLRRMPYDRIYNPVLLGFYCDAEMNEWNFFVDWMNKITEASKKLPAKEDEDKEPTRFFEYYTNYIGQVTIAQLNMLSFQTRLTTLTEAFPVNISPIQYGYENGDQVQIFTVSFQFRESKVEEGTFNFFNLTENLPGKLIDGVKSLF